MIAGNLLQQVYNLADTLIVGRYIGADALASVGSAYTLMIFITSIIIGLCMESGASFERSRKWQKEFWYAAILLFGKTPWSRAVMRRSARRDYLF